MHHSCSKVQGAFKTRASRKTGTFDAGKADEARHRILNHQILIHHGLHRILNHQLVAGFRCHHQRADAPRWEAKRPKRTYPFWPQHLVTPLDWQHEAGRCEGPRRPCEDAASFSTQSHPREGIRTLQLQTLAARAGRSRIPGFWDCHRELLDTGLLVFWSLPPSSRNASPRAL